jgi:GTP-binding protein Era
MKAGYVAITGEPNVGKSTLLNRLMQFKLSIVSAKPQTTRQRVLGILTQDDYQCYFLDTPGLIDPAYELQHTMVEQIKRSLEDADIIIWVIEPWFKHTPTIRDLLRLFKSCPIICAINKIDLVPRTDLLKVIDDLSQYPLQEIIPISARTGDGIARLKSCIFDNLPEGPFLYPSEDLSDNPERFFVAEIIREAIFERYKKEIPYATCVAIDEFKEHETGKDFIRAIIYVERKSQKGILIGKKGDALKHVGRQARKNIEHFLDRPVFLELWVKVRENWRKDKKFLKELGYQ